MTNAQETDQTLPFEARISYVPVINVALQQSKIAVVRELTLINRTGRDFRDIECRFTSPTEFILDAVIPVDLLKNGEELPLHDFKIELNYRFLTSISEEVQGRIRLEVVSQGETLFLRDYDMTAYSPDQWLGSQWMPELLCAFVTPNFDVVRDLLPTVSAELKKATQSDSIEGYQGGKKRAYEICSAIYRAIHAWGIHYANPAASFGTPGQRIRFADDICRRKLATCLDTTLLFASVMESCRLHPVILLHKGHAYVGCHLIERYFPDLPMEDLQTIRKLTDLDEFLVIETTLVTHDATFSEAETAARSQHLNIGSDFDYAIDVVRARMSGVFPLPLKRGADGVTLEIPDEKVDPLDRERPRDLQQEVDLSHLKDPSRTGRIARWTQKLLDLSLRNKLLNVRDTRLVIPIACPDITVLEDKLAANESISLQPLSTLLSEKDIYDMALLRNSKISSETKALLEKELEQRRLRTALTPEELSRRLTVIYRQARTDQEESGVNTLFIGIGFLEWRVAPKDEKSYLAPILLVPIRLQRKSIVEGFRISRIDEDSVINETLLELLRSQFQLTIPGLSPLPTDKSGIDVGKVMQIFRQTIKNMPGWEVREDARIGLFSFGKFVMWTDMTARADALQESPLVRHLIDGGGVFDDGIEVFAPEEVEKHLELSDLYCPMSADSSQLTAVLYSALGKNFVLHGPPGTGKSQTITNIIAQNLAMGKKVLFVSEKKAALDVVHRRLSAIGLRPFCLELHSNKAGKGEVLAQFAEALNIPETPAPRQWEQVTAQLQRVRDELNQYVSVLHRRYPNHLSAYDCFLRLLSLPASVRGLTYRGDCIGDTETELLAMRDALCSAAQLLGNTTADGRRVLESAHLPKWEPFIEEKLTGQIRDLEEHLQEICDALASGCGAELPEDFTGCDARELALLAEAARKLQTLMDFHTVEVGENFRFAIRTAKELSAATSRCLAALQTFSSPEKSATEVSLGALLDEIAALQAILRKISVDDRSRWVIAGETTEKFLLCVSTVLRDVSTIRAQMENRTGIDREPARFIAGRCEQLDAAFQNLQDLELQIRAVLDVTGKNTPERAAEMARILASAASELKSWEDQSVQLQKLLHLPLRCADFAALRQLGELAGVWKEIPDIPTELSFADAGKEKLYLQETRALMEKYHEMIGYFTPYKEEFWKNFDLEEIERLILDNEQCIWPISWWKNRKVVRRCAAIKRIGGKPLTCRELKKLLAKTHEFFDTRTQRDEHVQYCARLLPLSWKVEKTDWETLLAQLDGRDKIVTAAAKILPFLASGAAVEASQCRTGELLGAGTPGRNVVDAFLGGCRNFAGVTGEMLRELTAANHANAPIPEEPVFDPGLATRCCRNFQPDKPLPGDLLAPFEAWEAIAPGSNFARRPLGEVQTFLEALTGALAQYHSFFQWQECRANDPHAELQIFFDALQQGSVSVGEIGQVFDAVYAGAMLNQILATTPELEKFSRLTQEERIRKFCELDDQYTELARRIVFAKLAANLPRRRGGPCPEGSELGLLKRECEKKARQKPVRQLLAEIPALVPVLKPCFLMSPLSVAQYLPPDTSTFDLIVFDEASQIPVWDAIGVIARGKQLIVVGDPKQMPPTNFFQKGDNQENAPVSEEIEAMEDLESILDECLAAGVHSSYLNWHYRSRHEALISFSNHYYYDDRLYTFPAASFTDRLGVKFQFVENGVYDRRKTRTNANEAGALVDYVFTQLRKSGARKRSIGIVTFSEAQKTLIEDQIEARRADYPELESYFSDQNEEPFFVKNLENVQGDERDVILFSIGYAPDADGKFTMNFGPLNRQGGERRLNVAITRAKEQVVVFSSIHASQIDLARTNAVGAAHLKYFLDYAEKGVRVAPAAARAEKGALVAVIEKFLKTKGFDVECGVGSSEYRVDLAVRNPDRPEEFLLGIECDGPDYAAQKTTRDRDHLRYDVLRALGWHILQVWTLDWSFDRKQAEAALLAAIDKAKEQPANADLNAAVQSEKILPAVPEPPAVVSEPEAPEKITPYVPAVLECRLPQEQFYEPATRSLLRKQMKEIIDQEAPIYEKVLKKRMIRAWRFNRAGESILKALNAALPTNFPTTEIGEDRVFWRKDQDPENYREFRSSQPTDADKRSIDEIPPEELANAMYEVLEDFSSCEQDTLYRETVKFFGLSAVTQKARKYLDYGLEALRKSGRA